MDKLLTQDNATQIIETIKQAMGALCEMSQSLWEVMIKNQYIIGYQCSGGAICLFIILLTLVYCSIKTIPKLMKGDQDWNTAYIPIVVASFLCIWGVIEYGLNAIRCFYIPEYNIFIDMLDYIK